MMILNGSSWRLVSLKMKSNWGTLEMSVAGGGVEVRVAWR